MLSPKIYRQALEVRKPHDSTSRRHRQHYTQSLVTMAKKGTNTTTRTAVERCRKLWQQGRGAQSSSANGPSLEPLTPWIMLTYFFQSEIPYHYGASHIHGHDWLLPHDAKAACASTAQHAEVRPYRYAYPIHSSSDKQHTPCAQHVSCHPRSSVG